MVAPLAVIITLGVALLATTLYMEWIGVMNLFTTRGEPRYDSCGHLKLNRSDRHDRCWRCRHTTINHALDGLHQ